MEAKTLHTHTGMPPALACYMHGVNTHTGMPPALACYMRGVNGGKALRSSGHRISI